MKKLTLALALVLVVTIIFVCTAGCTKLDTQDGIESLSSAYANTRDNYNDIYQYSEKVYNKAVIGKEGHIINRVVNVNCAVDKHYNLIKNQNYAINIHEDMYKETIDNTSKLTTRQVAYNDIIVGESKVEGKKDVKSDALFVSSSTDDGDVKMQSKYVDVGESAKAFYDSEFFQNKQLMNKQIMQEIGLLNADNMNFAIKKGGIIKKGMTTDFTFKVSDDYLKQYRANYGRQSLLDGDRVWLQISHGRISNIYVYKTEYLGGNLTSEYEAYIFMITYLGKRVEVPKCPKDNATDAEYELSDIFNGNNFIDNILSPSIQ